MLAEDEVDLWKYAIMDLMSEEEDGGGSGWSQELTELCAALQSRL